MEKRHRILLVSSDAEEQRALIHALDEVDSEVVHAETGFSAIALLQESNFDLILATPKIGSLDIWRLARIVRSGVNRDERTLPIILAHGDCQGVLTESLAEDYRINFTISLNNLDQLPSLVENCLESPDHGLSKKPVLVIEDHKNTAVFIKKILENSYSVELAEDGESGLEMWRRGRHILVFLDVMLPGISGSEVLNQIIKIDPSQSVVMMTAYGSIDIARALMMEGASDFIAKPFIADDIRNACARVFRWKNYQNTRQITEGITPPTPLSSS